MPLQFDVASEVVALIYALTVDWVTMVYYPFSAWVVGVVHALRFKYDVFMLQRFFSRPTDAWSAKDTGTVFMIFTLVSFALLVLYSFLFMSVISPFCSSGPFSGVTGGTLLATQLSRVTGLSTVYSLVSNGWLIWGLVFALVARLLILRNAAAVLGAVVLDRQQAASADSALFTGIIKRLRARMAEMASRLKEA
jgi:hypothetical protein